MVTAGDSRATHPKRAARVLIVDDHEDNVALLRMMLAAQGYDIVCAGDGVQALKAIRATPPDLVLLDVMMPQMSGYDVVQAVRSDPSLGYIPIMLVTAKQDLSDKVKGLDVGADDFLPKPVQSAELIAKVRALLRLKQVQDALVSERNKNEMLYLVGQQLNSTLDVDKLVGETLNLMVNMIGANQGSVIIKHSKLQTWRKITSQPALNPTRTADASAQVIAEGLAGLALRARQPQLVADTLTDDRWLPVHTDNALPPVRTALAIPLVREDMEIGVLTLTHSEPHRFGPDQLPLVMAVAAQVISALHNASLYTQLKEAEAAREYVVHMLTHDLRGPLSGILGCLHVLEMSTQSEADLQFIEMARKACGAQEALISDILDVYRAESGMLELARTAFPPDALAQPVLDQLSGAALEKHVALHIDLPPQPTLIADQRKLSRVLINLVNNAIKFTRRGSVYVSAGAQPETQQMLFTVRDTGRGIPPSDVPYVFDRFFTARQVGARRGSGLGLNFCYEVVAAHGGQIWAESELGVGTTIFLTIPLKGETHDQMAVADRG